MATTAMSLSSLPTEVLEDILSEVGVENVSSLSRTCKRINAIFISSDVIWKRLFQLRFARLQQPSCSDELSELLGTHCGSWMQLSRRRLECGQKLRDELDYTADRYHSFGGLPDPMMEQFRALVRSYGTLMMRDALLDEIYPMHEHKIHTLSRSYYATMLYREVQREQVILPLMRSFMEMPYRDQTAGIAFHLFAFWMKPELDPGQLRDVDGCYRRIARLVIKALRKRDSSHPVAAWPDCKSNPWGATLWTDAEVLQIMECMNTIIYDQLELLELTGRIGGQPGLLCDQNCSLFGRGSSPGRRYQYYDGRHRPDERREVFATHAPYLRCGGDMVGLLSALYASVAGLLGVEMHFTRTTDFWLLCWERSGGQYVYVEVLLRGMQLSRGEALIKVQRTSPSSRHGLLLEPMAKDKFLSRLVAGWHSPDRMLSDSDMAALRGLHVWIRGDCQPHRIAMQPMCVLMESRRPMQLRRLCQERLKTPALLESVETEGLSEFLERLRTQHLRMIRSADNAKRMAKQRTGGYRPLPEANCRYRVGDIVQFGRHPHRRGVVYHVSLRQQLPPGQMQCCQCKTGKLEPGAAAAPVGRYHVLLDGGEDVLFVAERSIEFSDWPRPVQHPELGRYFSGYDGQRYVPLPWLRREFPEPAAAAAAAVPPRARRWPLPTPPTTWLGRWPRRLPHDHVFMPGEQELVMTEYELMLEELLELH